MSSIEDLEKYRPNIVDVLTKHTNGEIIDFEIFPDYISDSRVFYRILLEIPNEVFKKYNEDFDYFLKENGEKFIQVLTIFGFSDIFKKSNVWSHILKF